MSVPGRVLSGVASLPATPATWQTGAGRVTAMRRARVKMAKFMVAVELLNDEQILCTMLVTDLPRTSGPRR